MTYDWPGTKPRQDGRSTKIDLVSEASLPAVCHLQHLDNRRPASARTERGTYHVAGETSCRDLLEQLPAVVDLRLPKDPSPLATKDR